MLPELQSTRILGDGCWGDLIGVYNDEPDNHSNSDLWNTSERSHLIEVWADLDGAVGTPNAAH